MAIVNAKERVKRGYPKVPNYFKGKETCICIYNNFNVHFQHSSFQHTIIIYKHNINKKLKFPHNTTDRTVS